MSQAGLLLLASVLFQGLVGAGLYDAQKTLGLSRAQVDVFVMLLANGFLLAAVMHYRGMTYRDLIHPTKSSAKATAFLVVPPVLLLVPMLLLGAEVLNSFLERLLPLSMWEEQAFSRMVEPSLAAVIATCLLAPALEEMLFRGVILRAFLHQYPRGAAISMSAIYFGVAHLNIYQFALAFLFGLLLGWLFERSRSLLPCIALHATYNASIFFGEPSREAGAQRPWSETPVLPLFVAAAAAIVGIVMLHWVLARNPKVAPRREV